MNLDIIYGDQRCTFIIKKPLGWRRRSELVIPDGLFSKQYKAVKEYLNKTHLQYKIHWRTIFVDTLDFFGIRKFLLQFPFINKFLKNKS